MATTRDTIARMGDHLDESIGIRQNEVASKLISVSLQKDAGRRPLRQVGSVEIDRVIADPDQPRSEFDDEAIEQLAKSVREKGQLLPIHVRWSSNINKWVIISGERRWRAARHAGLPTVHCFFHDEALSPSEVLEQQLVENLLREDLKPVEQAKAFSALMELNGWNGKQIADALYIPASSVSRALALLQLPVRIQEQVDRREIAARSAYELSKVSDDDARQEMAKKAATGQLTHKQAASTARKRSGKAKRKPGGVRLSFLTETGFKVGITANRKGTYHDVEAALLEALEETRLRLRNNIQLM